MTGNPYQSSLDPVRVVVIDPSERARRVFSEALTGQDCVLVFARDGVEAMGKLDESLPGLVFVAAELPRLNGYQVSHIVHSHSRMRRVPVVLMSHDPDMFQRARGRLMGATEHLVSPVSSATILDAFQRLAG